MLENIQSFIIPTMRVRIRVMYCSFMRKTDLFNVINALRLSSFVTKTFLKRISNIPATYTREYSHCHEGLKFNECILYRVNHVYYQVFSTSFCTLGKHNAVCQELSIKSGVIAPQRKKEL